jgi:hypothetical protein
MKGDYPQFAQDLSHEELIEHFLLDETDHQFITGFRGDGNRYGVAVLLKSLQYLGYFPQDLSSVPTTVKLFIAKQLNQPGDPSPQYPWDSRTRFDHFVDIPANASAVDDWQVHSSLSSHVSPGFGESYVSQFKSIPTDSQSIGNYQAVFWHIGSIFSRAS